VDEKIETKKEEVKKIKRIGTKHGDKVFKFICKICKKKLLLICRKGEHLVDNEPEEKAEIFALSLGYEICPFCGKAFLFKHREDNFHSLY